MRAAHGKPTLPVHYTALQLTAHRSAAFNARMFEVYNSASLVKCGHCGRSFNEEAFAKHQKLCTAETPGGPHAKRQPGASCGMGSGPSRFAAPAGAGPGGGPAQKPRAYTCYLCGQQYGSRSLPIHIPKCQEKWLQVESQRPKAERRPLPEAPFDVSEPLPTKAEEIDSFNARMFEVYNGASLIKCERCGRSFHAEAFARHQKLCTADTPGGPHAKRQPGASCGMGSGPSRLAAPAGAGPGGGPAMKPRAYTCYLCGQQFGSKRCGRNSIAAH